MCNENVDTARLVQPNESKRRSKIIYEKNIDYISFLFFFFKTLGEELLKRIRERHTKNISKESDDASPPPPPPTSSSNHLLVPPV